MTLADRIRALYDGTRTTREIADRLGCRIEYVRVVARQRFGSRMSDIDRRYWRSPLGRLTQARKQQRFRDRHAAHKEAPPT